MRTGAFEIEILYFAILREKVGLSKERLALGSEATSIAELSSILESSRPALRGQLGNIRFAVGDDFVDMSYVLRDGDVVALIPPVSGG